MDKKEFEDLKKRIREAEFNNYEEDERITNERDNKDVNKENNYIQKNNNKDKQKNTIIYVLSALVVVLLIIVFIFVTTGKTENNNEDEKTINENQQDDEKNEEKDEKKDEDETKIDENDYDFSTGTVYLNSYVIVTSKNKDKKVITDLEGNIILKTTSSWKIFEGQKCLYVVDLNYKETGNINIKMIKDNKANDILNEKGNGLLLENDNNTLIGAYKQDSKNDILYILNNDKYDTIALDNYAAYVNNNSAKDHKYIYSGRYIITFDKMGQEEFEKYGIYDLKNKKQLTNGSYDRIEFLHDDVFVAVKNDKSGVISAENKVLYELKNELISYSNGLYFVGNNNKLQVLDNNFKSINLEIEVPNLSKFNYSICCGNINPFDLTPYKNSVILRIGYLPNATSEYIAINKNGTKIDLGKGYIGFANGILVVSNENDSNIRMYDETFNVTHTIDVGNKAIKLDNIYIYLNNTLVINRAKIYDLSKNISKGTTSWYRRTSQEFEVRIDFKGETGTVSVSRNNNIVKKIDNVSVNDFLEANNNGITITKNYLIYNADGVIIVKRDEKDVLEQEKR